MRASSAGRTPSEDFQPREPALENAAAPRDRIDRPKVTADELLRARYRHHLATGFTSDLAIVLAEWDVAGYLRVTGAARTDLGDRP
jgi:hypothetical protein